MNRTISISLIAMLLGGCFSESTPAPTTPSVTPVPTTPSLGNAEKLNIREALFRYQFDNNPSGLQNTASAYYLSVNDGDPSAALLARFAGNSPPVKPVSAYDVKSRTMLAFTQGSIIVLSPTHVKVDGGYFEFQLAALIRYELVKQEGEWIVTKAKVDAIS